MTDKTTIRFAERMSQLPPYLFGMINKMKMERRWNGEDVIDLGMGNPVDPAPDTVIEKLCDVAQDPKTHRYPVAGGMRNLRREIALYYQRNYQVDLDSENEVICTIGSKEGISHLCLALVGPGDTVLVAAPAFPIHVYAAVIAGASVIRVPIASEDEFVSRITTMCESLIPGPRLLMLNYPHNPTGTLASKDFFAQIVDLAKRYKFMVVNDFAYARVTFDGYTAPSFLQAKGAKDVGVEFFSMSKSYSMAGWRVGFCVGNPETIHALKRIKSYLDYGIFQPIQIASIIALNGPQDCVAEIRDTYKSRRDTLISGLSRAGWQIESPKGTMFVWAKIPEPFRNMRSVEFSKFLIREAQVAVSPGLGFGEYGDEYVRFALIENNMRINQAVRGIRKVL